MELTRNLLDSMKEVYGPYFPTPKARRQEFLDKVRDRVSYYKPKIEERCGIGLGEVSVKDNKHWLSDYMFNNLDIKAAELAWSNGRVPTEKHIKFVAGVASSAHVLAFLPSLVFFMFRDADFRHNNSTIYVPFNYMNRFMDPDFRKREKRLDYGVVHELSHSLWDKIAGREKLRGPFRTRRLWFEGFATYCADVHFSDFYPEGAERVNVRGVYADGRRLIERAIEKHGDGILLDIPMNWEELDKTVRI